MKGYINEVKHGDNTSDYNKSKDNLVDNGYEFLEIRHDVTTYLYRVHGDPMDLVQAYYKSHINLTGELGRTRFDVRYWRSDIWIRHDDYTNFEKWLDEHPDWEEEDLEIPVDVLGLRIII